MTAFLICVGTAAAVLVYVQRLAFQPAPRLRRQVTSWQRGRSVASKRAEAGPPLTRAGRWSAAGLSAIERRHPEVVRTLDQDLAVVGDTRESWVTRTLALALSCLLGPPALAPVLMSLRWPGPSIGALVTGGAALAVLAIVLSRRELHQKSSRRREEFRRGLSLYLDLVVMSMEAGRGHAEALPTVAGVGTGWVFDELRSTVTGARSFGITAWAALGRVGQRLGIAELIDLEASIELAQDEGGRVRDSLISRASSMRASRVADVHARAATRTDAMRNTLVLMALLTAAYVITARLLYLVTA